MKKDATTNIYKKVFNVTENHAKVNTFCKAVIINYNDGKGDIIVENDNFGTRRKYANFTNGRKKANLNPCEIVFSGLDFAKICNDRYINKNNEICFF
jgi:hypothetical protein